MLMVTRTLFVSATPTTPTTWALSLKSRVVSKLNLLARTKHIRAASGYMYPFRAATAWIAHHHIT